MWDRFQNKVKSAKWVEAEDKEDEGLLYTQVYQAYLTQIDESVYVSCEDQQEVSSRLTEKMVLLSTSVVEAQVDSTPITSRRSSVEDMEDEDKLKQKLKLKVCGLSALEDAEPRSSSPIPPVDHQQFTTYTSCTGEKQAVDVEPGPPPTEEPFIQIPRRKKTAPGRAAVRTSVLSIRGRVNKIQEREIDLHLDSGVDVSLVSQDFLDSLKTKPTIKQGMKMRLWQLTSKNESLASYVTLPLFIEAADGTILESEVEAYVVPGMSVDILLGEDYQLCHKIAVHRSVEDGTCIAFGGLPYEVRAVPVGRTKDFEWITTTHFGMASYMRAKAHRRSQVKQHRRRIKFGAEKKTIWAAADVKIAPNSVASLKVDGYFEEESPKDWLVEKSHITNNDNSFFAVPNVLFSSSHPVIPIMNPTDRPRYIHKGEIVGTITDPAKFLDTSDSPEQWEKMNKSVLSIASLIHCLAKDDADVQAFYTTRNDEAETEPVTEEAEPDEGQASSEPKGDQNTNQWGPKTAEMPDPQFYPSSNMEDLLNVGSLPEHLKEKAWEMLRKRLNVFAFDGRLGHHPTKVHICTVDGQVPIAV